MVRTEAKYMVICEAARKAIYQYLTDFRNKLFGGSDNDSQGAQELTSDLVLHNRMKHINTSYQYNHNPSQQINLMYLPTASNS
jgi:hypothetical protein